MAKYSEKLTEKICELIEDGEMTIAEICKVFKLSRKTFYEWKTTKKEFAEAIRHATEMRTEKLCCLGREIIRRKLNGYKTVEVKTTYVPNKVHPERMEIQKQVVTEKEHLPDASTLNLILKEAYRQTEKETAQTPAKQPFIIEVIDQETKIELEKLQRGERSHPAAHEEQLAENQEKQQEIFSHTDRKDAPKQYRNDTGYKKNRCQPSYPGSDSAKNSRSA